MTKREGLTVCIERNFANDPSTAACISLRLDEPVRVCVKLSFKMNCKQSEIRLACCFNNL